jgi:hypothetical protein
MEGDCSGCLSLPMSRNLTATNSMSKKKAWCPSQFTKKALQHAGKDPKLNQKEQGPGFPRLRLVFKMVAPYLRQADTVCFLLIPGKSAVD